MTSMLSHIRERRRVLRHAIDVEKNFAEWEESCVPSYLHSNFLAAFVSWQRLFVAAELAAQFVPDCRRVLDFGSSVGELSHLLKFAGDYDFVEQDAAAANYLLANNERAHRVTLEEAPKGGYDAVFAIDSLEHNEDYADLLAALAERLAPDGTLILSGPTENAFYRLGRRVAGFQGDYHLTTIFDIERDAARHLQRVRQRTVPFGIPLFRITAWKRRRSAAP
ncbi:methyltransferase domain-containing protein [Pelagibius marinus]|uniref:methyltransferase domain-containing protein n=1 Tax=Pelagibius marinus TaxID=2762760 RepID=UPI001872E786|nr:methyltransferase domain-containing protein [Pelagibius marinus]